jgi:uncharacterized membrane protein YcaP (DUF421 family)
MTKTAPNQGELKSYKVGQQFDHRPDSQGFSGSRPTVGAMWHSMFYLPVPVAEKILRAAIIYGFLVIALRIGGKRELAQLSSLDFILLMAVANAVQNGIIGNDNSVTGAVIGGVTLFVISGTLMAAVYASMRLRRTVFGNPAVLYQDGQTDRRAMVRALMSDEDLKVAVQHQGFDDLKEVGEVVLEPNGTVVATRRDPDELDRRIQHLHDKLDEILRQVHALGAG